VTFAALATGASVFLDANPLEYHFAPDPVFGATCHQLLSRIARGDILAYTSTHVLSETAHHLMTLEASTIFGWKAKIVQHLKQQPGSIQKLTNFRKSIEQVPQLGIRILAIPPPLIALAAALSQQHDLLSNDALILAVMQQQGLTNLASGDTDFDRVPGISRYAPV
jgi:predicted nucleic acid-binding protein